MPVLPPENATSVPLPGQLLFYPGGISEVGAKPNTNLPCPEPDRNLMRRICYSSSHPGGISHANPNTPSSRRLSSAL